MSVTKKIMAQISILRPWLLRMAFVLFGFSFFLAATMSRSGAIVGLDRYIIDVFLGVQFLLCVFLLFFENISVAICALVLPLAILVHSYANLYWPSLAMGVPRQDYMLFTGVSANYSFDSAKLYIRNIFYFVPGGILAGLYWSRASKSFRIFLFACIGLSFAMNLIAAAMQGLIDLKILTSGSGTAVSSRRAPGFLEDSGAATVYFAAITAMLFGFGLFTKLVFRKIAILLLFILSLYVGRFTGGRTYFLSVVISCFFVSCWYAHCLPWSEFSWRRKIVSILVLVGLLAVVAGFSYLYTPVKLKNAVAGLFQIKNIHAEQGLDSFAYTIDKGRWVHYKVLWRDFCDHFLYGSGLGSFFANNLYYTKLLNLPVVLRDNPSSLYLTFLAALGVSGILIFGAFFVLTSGVLTIFRGKYRGKDTTLHCHIPAVLAVSCLISLGVSFFVGIHLIFISVTSLLGLIAFGFAVVLSGANRFRRFTVVVSLLGVASILLGVRSFSMALFPPHAPEFRWKERGVPQVPNSINVPISPQGNRGVWLVSSAELAYTGVAVKVLAELPQAYYPLKVTVRFFDESHDFFEERSATVETYDSNSPWRLFEFQATDALAQRCSAESSPNSYCYIKIFTDPTWKWDGYPIGVFLVTGS